MKVHFFPASIRHEAEAMADFVACVRRLADQCRRWIERLSDGGWAINVVQPIALVEGGRA